MNEREESFEAMLSEVLACYNDTTAKMGQLKAAGKTKTVTYRELLAQKLFYQRVLTLYQSHGLID